MHFSLTGNYLALNKDYDAEQLLSACLSVGLSLSISLSEDNKAMCHGYVDKSDLMRIHHGRKGFLTFNEDVNAVFVCRFNRQAGFTLPFKMTSDHLIKTMHDLFMFYTHTLLALALKLK